MARLSISILRARLTLPYQLYTQCTAIQSQADPHPNFHLGWDYRAPGSPLLNPAVCLCVSVRTTITDT